MTSNGCLRHAITALIVVGALSLASCTESQRHRTDRQRVGPDSTGNEGELAVEPAELVMEARGTDERAVSDSATLTLRNVGAGPLTIVQIDPRCGCTAPVDLADSRLESGQSVTIELQAQLPRYGERQTSVVITTDSAATREVVIPMVLRGPELAAPYIQDAPSELALSGHQAGQILEDKIAVRTVESPGAPWVTGLTSASGVVSSGVPELADEKQLTDDAVRRVYHIAVRARVPDSAEEMGRDMLRIDTGEIPSVKPVPPIPVVVRFQPSIRVVPAEVTLRASSESLPHEQRVLLLPADDAPWELSLPSDLPPWLKIVDESDAANASGPRRLRLTVTDAVLTADSRDSSAREFVVDIACTHPACDRVRLPVRVLH